MRLPQYQHFTRLDTLTMPVDAGEHQPRLGAQASLGMHPPSILPRNRLPEELRSGMLQRTSHIYRLFLHWEYQSAFALSETDYKPTSPFKWKNCESWDEINAQVNYLAENFRASKR